MMKNSEVGFLRIIFLAVSIILILTGIFMPDNTTKIITTISIITICLVIVDWQAPRIAGLSKDNPKIKTLRTVNRITLTYVIVIMLLAKLKFFDKIPQNTSDIIKASAICLLMLIIGNVAPTIPFNRYVGLRLPWTIRDEATWRAAHKLLGYVSFPIAILQLILIFWLSIKTVMVTGILLWVGIPGIYSFWFYIRKNKVS